MEPSAAEGESGTRDSQGLDLQADEKQMAEALAKTGQPEGVTETLKRIQLQVDGFQGYVLTSVLAHQEATIRSHLDQELLRLKHVLVASIGQLDKGINWEGLERLNHLQTLLSTHLVQVNLPPPGLRNIPLERVVSEAQQHSLYEWELRLLDRVVSLASHSRELMELLSGGEAGGLEVELEDLEKGLSYFGQDWQRRQEQFAGLAMSF